MRSSPFPFPLILSMAFVIDSAACFEERLNDLSLGSLAASFNHAGWTTFGTFATSSSWVPGQPSGYETFKTDVVERLTGNRDHETAGALRRLFYEAYTMMAHDLRSRVEDAGRKHPKELPAVEQHARWQQFVARNPGKRFLPQMRPSFELCNLAAAMHAKNVLSYIPLSRCTVESGGPWPKVPWIDLWLRSRATTSGRALRLDSTVRLERTS